MHGTAQSGRGYGNEPDGLNDTITSAIAPAGIPQPGHRYRLPARQGRAVRLAAGQVLRLINTAGTQVCDLWAFNADDDTEHLSMEHLRTALGRITVREGDRLVTNRRRPILTVVRDTSPGVHDTLIAACDLHRYRQLGVAGYHDNCTDNLRMAMIAIGTPVRTVPAPLNVWMNTPVRADGGIAWLPTVARPGDVFELRADMACTVAMSACPQDIVPINGEGLTPADLNFEVV
ncbi:DUF1989 domain-containing protein [Azospirillum halopraeferens]|uniref:DUF1989 domain-containing protein n=1 Tax=Azospirillum halopraeferens TaxID=34010 RepID=UPI0003FDAB52|nr:urea carboxylase-associated family protein [Azospirillum halopraeferens]